MPVRSRWALPEVVDPPDHLCVTVPVPNERYHIAAFLGAIYELTRPYSWGNDDAHTAILVGAVWQKIFDSLKLQLCSTFDTPIAIEEWIDEMSLCDNIRFSDGVLQVLCCGQWVAVDGQSGQGIGGPGQPGGGSPTPGAGQCQLYHAVLNGNDQWLAPAVVNSGDTIQISNLKGAYTDGGGLWFCPDGKEFFAGFCTATTVLDALDPLPAQPHMTLLSKIAGTFTNVAGGGVITVPGGVSNALLIFQANDHSLADNSGQITFDVNVCNNTLPTWNRRFDFRLNSWGVVQGGSVPAGGHWTPGVGLDTDDSGPDSFGHYYRVVSMILDLGGTFTLTAISMQANYAQGSVVGADAYAQLIYILPAPLALDNSNTSAVNGTNINLNWSGSASATGIEISERPSNANSSGGLSGSARILQLEVSGTGIAPTIGTPF